MKNVALVTGGTGFVGFHLCTWLMQNNYHVIATGRKSENKPPCNELYTNELNEFPHEKHSDISVCFHLAANNNTLDSDVDSMIESNVNVPITLFQNLLQQNNCKNFVYASSCSVYGNQPAPFVEDITETRPLNPYAVSKLEFEKRANNFAEENSVRTIGLRYSNVYGPKEGHKEKRASMIHQLIEKISLRQEVCLFENGQQLRDWVFVDDVVKANVKAMSLGCTGIYNVGYGKPYSFNYLVEIISRMMHRFVKIKYIPCDFTQSYQNHTAVDLTKSTRELKWEPEISVPEGIRMMI